METLELSLTGAQMRALMPILFLCVGVLLSTITAGLKIRGSYQRVLGLLSLGGFVILNFLNLPYPDSSILGSSLFIGLLEKISAIVVGVLALAACTFVDEEDHPEWLPLLMISVVGLSLVVGARDWISFFVYLETFAMPSYVLASLRLKKDGGFESGIKYLMMGAFSSAIFLLGITLVYGFSGSFDFLSILEAIRSVNNDSPMGLLYAGFSLIVISVGFKVALAPFHMWAPDVYQSAPAALASFLATAVKFSVFVAAFAAFSQSGILQVPFLQASMSAFGILSILVGNLMALRQTNLRRMIAYASVASAGNAALVFAVGPVGLNSVFLYLAIYGFNLVALFALVEWAARSAGLPSSSQADLKCLAQVVRGKPLVMACLGIVLFSLVGLPPLPGFFGKYLLLRDLLRADLYIEAGALLLGSLLSLAYYLKIFIPIALESSSERDVERTLRPASMQLIGFYVSTALLVFSGLSIAGYFRLVGDSSLFLR
jgi:NADH-quinone oxidoreductase subunit N